MNPGNEEWVTLTPLTETSSFILDQPDKFFFFCPLWDKKYFRFAEGKSEH